MNRSVTGFTLLGMMGLLMASPVSAQEITIIDSSGAVFSSESFSNATFYAEDFQTGDEQVTLSGLAVALQGMARTAVEASIWTNNPTTNLPETMLGQFDRFTPSFADTPGGAVRTFSVDSDVILDPNTVYWLAMRATSPASVNWAATRSAPSGVAADPSPLDNYVAIYSTATQRWTGQEPRFASIVQTMQIRGTVEDTTAPGSVLIMRRGQAGGDVEGLYEATDNEGGSGVARVDLYVRPWLETEWTLVGPMSEGAFAWTAPGNGVYEFTSVATDLAGNAEVLGAAPIRPVAFNATENAPFTWDYAIDSPFSNGRAIGVYPMTDRVEMVVTMSLCDDCTPTATISRQIADINKSAKQLADAASVAVVVDVDVTEGDATSLNASFELEPDVFGGLSAGDLQVGYRVGGLGDTVLVPSQITVNQSTGVVRMRFNFTSATEVEGTWYFGRPAPPPAAISNKWIVRGDPQPPSE